MSTIRSQFEGGWLIFNEFHRITGTHAVSQFPNIPCSMARLLAYSTNAGSVFIGTVLNTGTVNYLPYELDAGYDTGWISISNLNLLYQGSSSGSNLAAWIQK